MDMTHLLALNRVLKDSDLTYNEVMVVAYVGDHPGCRPMDIVGAVMVRPAAVTRALNELEDQGVVVRTVDRSDRRSIKINLSPAGQMMYAEFHVAISGIGV